MKFCVKDMDIATGGINIAILNKEDAENLDLRPGDRVLVKFEGQELICVLDISESQKAVPRGKIGLFEEVLDYLQVKHGAVVELKFTAKPESVSYIRQKLFGEKLNYEEVLKKIQLQANIASLNLACAENKTARP